MSNPKKPKHCAADYLLPNHVPHAISYRDNLQNMYRSLIEPPKGIFLPEFPLISQYMNGFRMNEFSILCGSTGSGKTQLLAGWASAFLKQGRSMFIASVETGANDFQRRMMSVLTGHNLVHLNKPLDPAQAQKIIKENTEYHNGPNIFFSLYDNRVSHEVLLADMAYYNVNHGCEIAILDNINFFLDTEGRSKEVIEMMDTAVHAFVMFAKHVKIHPILVMHPKKNHAGDTRVLSEWDIKGSSTAVQEASNVIMFNRPAEKDVEDGKFNEQHREVFFNKLRNNGTMSRRTIVLHSEDGITLREVGDKRTFAISPSNAAPRAESGWTGPAQSRMGFGQPEGGASVRRSSRGHDKRY